MNEDSLDLQNPDFVSIYTTFDQLILPYTSSILPSPVKNMRYEGIGHVGLLSSKRIFNDIEYLLDSWMDKQEREPEEIV